MTDKEKEKDKKQADQKPKDPSFLEWAVAVVGILLVGFAIGTMIYRGLTNGNMPPKISVAVEEIAPAGERFLVTFRVKNEGDSAVASLTVEGELKNVEGREETSDATIGYVPSHSDRHGGLFFTTDPRNRQFQIRVKGFEKP